MNFLKSAIVGMLFLLLNVANGQIQVHKQLKISLFEAETLDPVPFAKVKWNGSDSGYQTDFDGKLVVKLTHCLSDSLKISFSELRTVVIYIDTNLRIIEKTVMMNRESVKIEGVSISLGINPAMKWVELAINNREQNNPDEVHNYECEVFSKTVLSVNNISKRIEKLKVGRQINALFDTLEYLTGDTTKAVLPVFFSTTLSSFYHQKGTLIEREDIMASRVKGVGITDGSSATQLTGSTFAKYNVYRNRLQILGKGITSPIAPLATAFYNYKLIDVDKTHPLRWFVVKVSPKNQNDILFSGIIWIEEVTGAVTRLNLEINEASKINFLERLRIIQEYGPSEMPNLPYTLMNSRSLVDVAELTEESIGFLATNVITYRNYKSIDAFAKNFFDQGVIVADDALNKSDSFWIQSAHIKPNIFEQKVVDKIEAVSEIPAINRSAKALNFLIGGYYTKKNWKIELGPYYYLALLNPLEGFRTRWGFRTSNNLSKKWQFEGYGAYGFKDQRFKYGTKLSWYKNVKKGEAFKINRSEDTELLGFVDNEYTTSGDALVLALNMFFSNSLAYSKNTSFSYERDLWRGLNLNLKFNHRIYNLPESQKLQLGWFVKSTDSEISTVLNNATFNLKLTYEPQVFYVIDNARRYNYASPGPKLTFLYQKSVPDIFGSTYDYTKLGLNFDYSIIWTGIGRTQLKVTANKMFGNVPFPLLNIPLGNQTFIYNARAFNQMNLYEFVSDQNIEGIVEHHFNGLIFNRIPLLNKLGWREIIDARIIDGSLSSANQSLIPTELKLQNNITPIKSFNLIPYVELGFGVENIFKFVRVDFMWRVTHQSPGQNFGIKLSSYISF